MYIYNLCNMGHIHLSVIRKAYRDTYTIGKMYINGEYFCDTLEDKVRVMNSINDKIKGETAIPAGTYKITLEMSPRFKRKLPLLHDVPYFSGILIHRGNTAKDTHGCILVGENKVKGQVINSTKAEVALMDILTNAVSKGDTIDIEVK